MATINLSKYSRWRPILISKAKWDEKLKSFKKLLDLTIGNLGDLILIKTLKPGLALFNFWGGHLRTSGWLPTTLCLIHFHTFFYLILENRAENFHFHLKVLWQTTFIYHYPIFMNLYYKNVREQMPRVREWLKIFLSKFY